MGRKLINVLGFSLAYNPDGSVHNWDYKPDVARSELCRLIARLNLSLGIGETETWEEHIVVTPSVLRPKQTIKSCHEHHVYVMMHVIEGVDKFLVT